MTRIDSATITLDVWDDTLGMRREVTFDVPAVSENVYARTVLRALWNVHEARIRLAAKDGDMGPLTL